MRQDTTLARTTVSRGWPRLWLLAMAGFAAFALVACGGDDDETKEGGSSEVGWASSGAAEPAPMPDVAVSPSMPSMGMPPMDRAAQDGREESAFGPAGSPSGGFGGDIRSNVGRAVIRNGSVDLVVESVSDAFEQVRRIAESTGGYVSSSTFTGREESERAYLTLRVPTEQFGETIERLRDLAITVDRVSTGSQDVTEEYADLQARMRNLRALEEQFLTLLSEARDIGEVLQVQDRLYGVRGEIERVEGRINLLDNLTGLSTIEVSLAPERGDRPGPTDPGFGDRIRDAWTGSLDTLAAIGTGIVVALVWGWWIIPLALGAAVVVGRLVRRWLAKRRTATSVVDTPDDAA